MKVFEFESVAESYVPLLRHLLEYGEEVSPRGMLTKEITPVTIVINNPRKRVVDHPLRRANYGFMVGELLWILQGKNDLSISHYNKQWNNFSDDGEILNGAYGQRIFNWDGGDFFVPGENNKYDIHRISINQFYEVYKRLKNDKESRQGTISMFDPVKDFADTKDVPCTNLIRFSIRNDKLNMMVVMRSNDIIKGYTYDIYNFTMLQEIMAGLLDVEVGKYTHIADSFHLYESDFELAEKLINTPYDSIYNNFTPLDVRLNLKELDKTNSIVFEIENITRETGDVIEVETLIEKLKSINNEYWRSLAAIIIVYNLRKYRRDQEELDIFKKYITNEFSKIETVANWKTLKK